MRRFTRARCGVVFSLVLLCGPAAVPAAVPYDDCDAGFIAYIGSEAYQFSPAHAGELGSVRLFTVLSYQKAAALGDLCLLYTSPSPRD